MIGFHLTKFSNLNSIKAYGILPSIPQNSDHHDLFLKYNWCNDRGEISYFWRDDGNLDKYIRDFIYAKYFIHPRIEHYNNLSNNNVNQRAYEFIHKNKDKLFAPSSEKFILLKVDIDGYEIDHIQTGNTNILSTNYYFDTKYEHQNKPLLLHQYSINFFDIIQEVNISVKKNKIFIKTKPINIKHIQ